MIASQIIGICVTEAAFVLGPKKLLRYDLAVSPVDITVSTIKVVFASRQQQ